MKRIVVLNALLLAVAVSVFPDIYFWGWGTALWKPLVVSIPEEGDAEFANGVQAPWGGDMEAQFTISGDGQYSGFRIRMMAKGTSLRLGDQTYLWVSPQPWVTIMMGKVKDYSMEGQESVEGIGRQHTLKEADDVFRRAGTIDKAWAIFSPLNPQSWSSAMDMTGVLLSFHVTDSLFLGAYYNPGSGLGSLGNYAFTDPDGKPGAYQKAQAVIGYNIPAIGRFRLQYVGKDVYFERDNIKSDQLEAAFSLTMIPSMFFECGFKVPLQENETVTGVMLKNDYSAAFNVLYNFGYFDLAASFDIRFGGYRIETNGIKNQYEYNIQAYLVPSYDFGNLRLGGDIGFEYVAGSEGGMDLGAALWINRQFELSSRFQMGIAVKFPTEFAGAMQETEISFPIRLVYHF